MTEKHWTYDSDGVFQVEVVKTEGSLAYCRTLEGHEIGVFKEELFTDKQKALDAHEQEWPELLEDNQDDQDWDDEYENGEINFDDSEY